jgi:uncharacterized delta-60 repeat protein
MIGLFTCARSWFAPQVPAQSVPNAIVITTLAGSPGQMGSADGLGATASFRYPEGVAVDSAGNVYVADTFNLTIRRITPDGLVTTFAGMPGVGGSADGTGGNARFSGPVAVALDASNNVYVSDSFTNFAIRKITPTGTVTTLAGGGRFQTNGLPMPGSSDGTGTNASFSFLGALAVDANGTVFVVDSWNGTIRKITPQGVVTTLAGSAGNPGSVDGTGSDARFNYPRGIAVAPSGEIYVSDTGNNTIRKLTQDGIVTTLAGVAGPVGTNDGTGNAARFWQPSSIAVAPSGNLYVGDGNRTIRKVTSDAVVTTIAGVAGVWGSDDGVGSSSRFGGPYGPSLLGVTMDGVRDVMFVADTDNHTIRKGVGLFNLNLIEFPTTDLFELESSGVAVIPVVLTRHSTNVVTVDYQTGGGSAVPGQDYMPTNGTLTFLPGQTSNSIVIPIIRDGVVKFEQTVMINLTHPTGDPNFIPGNHATLHIIDDTNPLSFDQAEFAGTEGETNLTIGVLLSRPSSTKVTVDFATSDRTATAGLDYIATNGTLTFLPGQTSNSFNLSLLRDSLVEPTETLLITLSNPTGDAGIIAGPVYSNQVVVDIQDDTGAFQFSAPTFTVSESAGFAQIGVTRTRGLYAASFVNYRTDDGTAIAGTDYQAQSGTLTFAPGETYAAFNLPIFVHNVLGSGRTVNLTLSNPSAGNGLGSQSSATLNILGPDSLFGFSATKYELNEFGGGATITVIRAPPGTNYGSVSFATSDGTAIAGLDYQPQSGSLYFGPSQTRQTFSIPVLPHNFRLGSQTVNLLLFDATGGIGLSSQHAATLTILNAPAAVEFAAPDFNTKENAGNAAVVVPRLGDPSLAFTVDFATSNGTAVAGKDYVSSAGTIVFNAGETNKSISIAVLDDSIVNGDRTVQLTLRNPTGGAVLGVQQTAVLTIQDNEIAPASLVDLSFDPGTGIAAGPDSESFVQGMVVQSDDKVVVCGFFFQAVTGLNFPSLVRFNPDGTVDASFAFADPDRAIQFSGGLVQRSDGHLLVGSGIILDYDPQGHLAGTWRGVDVVSDVSSLIIQSNGAVIASGPYTVGRLQPDGQSDSSFHSPRLESFNGNPARLNSVALQQDGKIIIAGRFNLVNGVVRGGVARLNTDGSLDQSFEPQIGLPDGHQALASQADGKVLIGGQDFFLGTNQQVNLVRLNTDGSLDPAFIPRHLGYVYTVVLQPDGRALVGTQGGVTRLNPDGTTDASFMPAASTYSNGHPYSRTDGVFSIGFQSSGKIIMAGNFDVVSGVSRAGIARLYPDNAHPVVLQFADSNPSVLENVGTAVVPVERVGESSQTLTVHYATSDGTAVAGRDYAATSGVLAFLPGQTIAEIIIPVTNDSQPEGPRTINLSLSSLAGDATLGSVTNSQLTILDNDFFTTDQTNYDVNENDGSVKVVVQRFGDTLTPLNLNYLTSDGALPDCSECPRAAKAGVDYIQAAGNLNFGIGETNKLLSIPILGSSRVNGDRAFAVTLSYNSNLLSQAQVTIHDNETPATVDFSFNAGDGLMFQYGPLSVNSLSVQSDGRILIGGTFDSVNGVPRTNLARLNRDGSLDPSFNAGTSLFDVNGNGQQVTILYVQTNGQIMAAGNFDFLDGVQVNGLGRLNPDGSLDNNFTSFRGVAIGGRATQVQAAVVQPDGKIIIGGGFDTVNGVARTNLVRLDVDGSLDNSFVVDAGLAFPPGSSFISSLALEFDGRIIVGGVFSAGTATNIARLDIHGVLDTNFLAVTDDVVQSLVVESNGTILVSGQFGTVDGVERMGLARLTQEGALDADFNPVGNRHPSAFAVGADEGVFVATTTCFWGCTSSLERLNPEGSDDQSLSSVRFQGNTYALVAQPDGGLLVGGSFQSISWNLTNGVASYVRRGLARLYDRNQPVVQFGPNFDPNMGLYFGGITVNEDDGFAKLSVQRLGDSSAATTVDYATADADALAGLNYVATNGSLAFAPLETTKTIIVPILTDHRVTGDLQFRIILKNLHDTGGASVSTRLGLASATVTIRDVDFGFMPSSVRRLSDGTISLTLNAPASAQFIIEASSDLVNWVPIASNQTNVIDTQAPGYQRRFYRARMLGP